MFLEPPFNACEEPAAVREPSLAEQLGQFVRAARGAFSDSTERALRSDLAIYAAWCAERGRGPLPATPATIAAFVDAKAETRAPATVRRYVTSIAIAHRAVGLENTVKSPPVQLALKRMHRKKGRRQDQAMGLTSPLRRRLLEAAGDRLLDDRNRALLAVATTRCSAGRSLCHCKSLTCLRNCQETAACWCAAPRPIARAGARSSGSPGTPSGWSGRGSTAPDIRRHDVPRGPQGRSGRRAAEPLRGAAHLQGDGARGRLPETVVAGLSGHSTRVGATQDMVAAGIELPAILHAGRWKSTAMVNRYGERLLARRSGAAQLARMQDGAETRRGCTETAAGL